MKKDALYLLFGTFVVVSSVYADADDFRSYQHGIDLVSFPNNALTLVWSSGGNPPSGEWTHDVYISPISRNNPTITPKVLLRNDEAQEPVSASVNSDGNMMVTMEDGWDAENEIAQRYGVYTSTGNPVRAYPQLVLDGGHSGHVTAVGKNFVIFYAEGWVDGGGVDNLGSGDDVYASVYSTNGALLRTVDVAVSSTRDWWPLVAGSPTRALLVWQRFVSGATHADLMVAVLDPVTGSFVRSTLKLEEKVTYYTYSVTYVPAIDSFLVLGTYIQGGGFAYVLDTAGNVTAKNTSVPPIVRESQSVVRNEAGKATIVQARAPSGVMVLSVSKDNVVVQKTQDDTYNWQYMGVDGVFLDEKNVYMVALSTQGLIERTYVVESAEVKDTVVQEKIETLEGDSSLEDVLATTVDARSKESLRFFGHCHTVTLYNSVLANLRIIAPYFMYTPTAKLLMVVSCAK